MELVLTGGAGYWSAKWNGSEC